MENKEGWSNDITAKHTKTHYYKNGTSLCGKAEVKKYMRSFDKERLGNKYFKDCSICIKKQKEIVHAEPLCYKKNYTT